MSVNFGNNRNFEIGDLLKQAAGGNNAQVNLIADGLDLAIALQNNNLPSVIGNLGELFTDLGSALGGQPQQSATAQQPPLNSGLNQLLQGITGLLGGLGGLLGGQQGSGAGSTQGTGTAPAGGGSGSTQGAAPAGGSQAPMNLSQIFGMDNPFAMPGDPSSNPKAAAGAAAALAKGSVNSLGALLALVGSLLSQAMKTTMGAIQQTAQQLAAQTDAAAANKQGGSGDQVLSQQRLQELTFNLQQIQQTLNRVNETVTNISRSSSDANKSVTQNLSV